MAVFEAPFPDTRRGAEQSLPRAVPVRFAATATFVDGLRILRSAAV